MAEGCFLFHKLLEISSDESVASSCTGNTCGLVPSRPSESMDENQLMLRFGSGGFAPTSEPRAAAEHMKREVKLLG